MPDWSDQLAGARMQVDQQFQDRVVDSQFSNQQWGLIMTAVDWDVHRPEDPEAARLAADTSNLPDIIPELDRIQQQVAGQAGPVNGGAEGGGGGLTGRVKQFFDSLTDVGGESSNDEQLQAAEALVQDYARELQAFLEKHNRWEEVREAAAGEAGLEDVGMDGTGSQDAAGEETGGEAGEETGGEAGGEAGGE